MGNDVEFGNPGRRRHKASLSSRDRFNFSEGSCTFAGSFDDTLSNLQKSGP